MEHPSNSEVAQVLEEMSEHLAWLGRQHPARAYRRAAEAIRRLPTSVGALAMSGHARALRGVGSSIEARIIELCETGAVESLERLREQAPVVRLVLDRMRGVGPVKAERIWQALQPETLDELADALDDGRLLSVRGVGPATVDAIRDGLFVLEEDPEHAAVPLLRSHARRAAADIEAVLAHSVPGLLRTHLTGQLARGCELVDVIDLVLVVQDGPAATAALREHLDHRGWHTVREDADEDVGEECRTFALHAATGAGVRLHVTDPGREALTLLQATGPAEHARAVAALAGPSVTGEPSEREVYAAAGLAWVPPELRDRPDAVDLAAAGTLPALVHVEDLRGELHCHSTWSDGRARIADMAAAAMARGGDYLCITDHSWSLRMVNGLGPDDLAAQWAEIEEVRADLPDGFTLLHGTEMEIRGDGSLDFSDDVLGRLDWVVASIHVQQRQPAEVITRRMEQAMRNPLVDCIGHPTSRLLLRRPSTELDTDRLIELAASTGTFLEINASPDRLDLDSPTAARAAEAGVLLCINSDAHGTETLELVEHGVAVARRAALAPADIINARPWGEVRELQPRWR